MEDTSRPKGKREMRSITLTKEDKKETHIEKKVKTQFIAEVKPPQLLSSLDFSQQGHHSHEEAIYMDEDLYCIDDGEKLKEVLHRSVGALTFLSPHNKRGFGSGVLISRDTVLTAAHNIYQRLLRQKNKEFRFYLGANGETQNFYQIQSWKYPKQYQTCDKSVSREYDYAMMKLKKPVNANQFLPIQTPCSICLLKDTQMLLKVYGFPATEQPRPNEKVMLYKDNFKVLSEDGKKIKLHQYGLGRSDRIRFFDVIDKKIGYEMSTLPGQSGSPVTINNSIIAIHTGDGTRKQFNEGRIIDKDFLENAKRWRDELKTQSFSIKKKNDCSHRPFIIGTFNFTDNAKIERIGFGTMISKNLVLTAAHNLFDREKQLNYQNFKIYLGSTIKMGQRYFEIESYQFPNQFKKCKSTQAGMYDYALVKLKGEVPFDQFMEISLPCLDCIYFKGMNYVKKHKIPLELYSFPKYICDFGGKQPNNSSLNKKDQQIRLFQYRIFQIDDILELDGKNFQMSCVINTFQTRNGGSPLIINNQIIGLHQLSKQSDNINIIKIIDRDFVDNIEAWSKQMNGIKYSCSKMNCHHIYEAGKFYKIDNYKMTSVIHRSICGVYSTKYDQASGMAGTGILLSKNIVLTAAQMCHNRGKGEFTNSKVYFGEDKGISKRYHQVQSFRYNQQYFYSQQSDKACYDYAILKLKKPVNYDKFYKISLPCKQCIMKQNNTISTQIFSFPIIYENWNVVGKDHNEAYYFSLEQYGSEGLGAIMKFTKQYEINHALITHKGTGGSPILFKGNIIAVQIGRQFNGLKIGRLITPDFVANIKKWCTELIGEDFQVLDENHICE